MSNWSSGPTRITPREDMPTTKLCPIQQSWCVPMCAVAISHDKQTDDEQKTWHCGLLSEVRSGKSNVRYLTSDEADFVVKNMKE